MKLLLTSSGISNASIRDALVGLLGKPIAESSALFVPTAIYPFPGGPGNAFRAISGNAKSPLCDLGWKSLGVLELTALPSIDEEASLICLVILSYPVFAGSCRGSGPHRGGVAWAFLWKPAPRAAPRARWGRLGGSVQVVLTRWSRFAARGSGGRAGVACPSGRWPPRGRGGEGAVRRLGARRAVLLRGVAPALGRSRPEA